MRVVSLPLLGLRLYLCRTVRLSAWLRSLSQCFKTKRGRLPMIEFVAATCRALLLGRKCLVGGDE